MQTIGLYSLPMASSDLGLFRGLVLTRHVRLLQFDGLHMSSHPRKGRLESADGGRSAFAILYALGFCQTFYLLAEVAAELDSHRLLPGVRYPESVLDTASFKVGAIVCEQADSDAPSMSTNTLASVSTKFARIVTVLPLEIAWLKKVNPRPRVLS